MNPAAAAEAASRQAADLHVTVVVGAFGYPMKEFGFEPAPHMLAFALGPMPENDQREALIRPRGT